MARVFDSSFEGRDIETRSRHGLPWMVGELALLKELYLKGKSLEEMCEELQRPATGTLIKLLSLGCLLQEISHRTYRSTYYYRMPLNTDAAAVNEAMN